MVKFKSFHPFSRARSLLINIRKQAYVIPVVTLCMFVEIDPACINQYDTDLALIYLLTRAQRPYPALMLAGPAILDSATYAGIAFVAGCVPELHGAFYCGALGADLLTSLPTLYLGVDCERGATGVSCRCRGMD